MRVVALLAVRNEAVYLRRCLEHLHEQGVETCVIDNDSTDGTREIAESFADRGVFRIERYPYEGFFDWTGLLKLKEMLAKEILADWFIHHDADEIREAPAGWGTLAQAIGKFEAAGFNAIDFAELVFLPDGEQIAAPADYVRALRHYYYFQPSPLHRVNAWKNLGRPVDLVPSGGHQAQFAGRTVAPEQFVLRHYIGPSTDYLREKYALRKFSEAEVRDRGWHGWRAEFAKWRVSLPSMDQMKVYRGDGVWDKSDPKTAHQFVVRAADA